MRRFTVCRQLRRNVIALKDNELLPHIYLEAEGQEENIAYGNIKQKSGCIKNTGERFQNCRAKL